MPPLSQSLSTSCSCPFGGPCAPVGAARSRHRGRARGEFLKDAEGGHGERVLAFIAGHREAGQTQARPVLAVAPEHGGASTCAGGERHACCAGPGELAAAMDKAQAADDAQAQTTTSCAAAVYAKEWQSRRD